MRDLLLKSEARKAINMLDVPEGERHRGKDSAAECPAVLACSLLQDFSKPGGHGWGLGGDGWSAMREKIQRFRPSGLLVSRRWGAVAGGDQLKPN
jgi:hypothetical protein